MTTETKSRLKWQPIVPFGVTLDFDLRTPLTAAEQAEFRNVFFRESLVVAKGQALEAVDQAKVLALLGPVLPAEGDARYLATDGMLGNLEFSFHSDFSFCEEPFDVISLHAKDVIDGESHTRFSNGIRAYAALPPALREKADRLKMLSAMLFRRIAADEPVPAHYPQVTRDVVVRHPVTGAPILFVIEQHAVRLLGLPPAESDALMADFGRYLFAPGNIYKHVWHNGDIVIWDNLALQHARPSLAHVKRRLLQRVCVGRKHAWELLKDLKLEDPEELLVMKETRDACVGRWAPADPL